MTRPRVNQKALSSYGYCRLIPVYKLRQGKEANKSICHEK
ncbi:hypothetical protein FVEG_15843 [Fusarium verticillioides 7600]|uniref:Uncharacterized protein n=1 Tax=Gibberella moniliformis (strain M3125 / FGSC 7600) TaxID=334819 RepID=W7M1Y4_GIBM7|nr:hypothetical protein FVEG_15843 [Fusarium verticillioides 7600]EWG45603.1 hypothetical protein FVEG_15843 [Fusarium verticillioides 7600]